MKSSGKFNFEGAEFFGSVKEQKYHGVKNNPVYSDFKYFEFTSSAFHFLE